jgi:hypothetical protein
MLKSFIFFIIGILLIVSRWQKFVIVDVKWIVLCFGLFVVASYVSIHKKNKERNTPRPVYLANPQKK